MALHEDLCCDVWPVFKKLLKDNLSCTLVFNYVTLLLPLQSMQMICDNEPRGKLSNHAASCKFDINKRGEAVPL